jgi:hypothetical protein
MIHLQRKLSTILSVSLILAACTARETRFILWRGRRFQELNSLRLLPVELQKGLRVGEPGLNGIADRDGHFNVTDVVDSGLPMKRFVFAGRSEEGFVLVIEHGGFSHNFEVSLFPMVAPPFEATETWVLSDKPSSLKQLFNELEKRGPSATR